MRWRRSRTASANAPLTSCARRAPWRGKMKRGLAAASYFSNWACGAPVEKRLCVQRRKGQPSLLWCSTHALPSGAARALRRTHPRARDCTVAARGSRYLGVLSAPRLTTGGNGGLHLNGNHLSAASMYNGVRGDWAFHRLQCAGSGSTSSALRRRALYQDGKTARLRIRRALPI